MLISQVGLGMPTKKETLKKRRQEISLVDHRGVLVKYHEMNSTTESIDAPSLQRNHVNKGYPGAALLLPLASSSQNLKAVTGHPRSPPECHCFGHLSVEKLPIPFESVGLKRNFHSDQRWSTSFLPLASNHTIL